MVEKNVGKDDWKSAKNKAPQEFTNNVYNVERMLPLYQMIFSKNLFDRFANKNLRNNLKTNE